MFRSPFFAGEPSYGKDFANELADWEKPEWVSRKLGGRLRKDRMKRARLFGASRHNLRFYEIDPLYRSEILEDYDLPIPERNLTDFCGDCASCPFRAINCKYAEDRLVWEKTTKGKALAQAQRERIEAAEGAMREEKHRREMEAERVARDAMIRAAKYKAISDGEIDD